MNKYDATRKVSGYRGVRFTDDEICEKIGISKPTLYTRLKKNNWKKGEMQLILSL